MSNTINKQTPVTPTLSDRIALWGSNIGRTASTSLTLLLELFQNNLVFPDAGRPEANTQYSAPSATGFTVLIEDNNEDTYLILTPVTAYANGAITLPLNTNLRDKQQLTVSTTQAITTFAINLNGASGVTGSITGLGADDYFKLQYDLTLNTWYRIG